MSVSDLLGKNIVVEQDSSSLDTIALELEKLNELLVTQQMQRANLKKKMISAITIIVFVLFIMAIYDRWNELFYDFGQSIYRWFH